jgi:hypothetical protein
VDLQQEFALDTPTLRRVPAGARHAAADATKELCAAVLRAPERSLNETRAWKLLLLRERLLFFAPLNLPAGSRSEGRRADPERLDLARLVRERVGRLLRGDWAALLAEARTTARALRRNRGKNTEAQRDESYLADEVCRKALAGEYSRACALLASPGLAPLNAETAERLQALLQPPDRATPPLEPRPRPAAGPALFSERDTRTALKSTPKGSGAAVGGARWEHWRVVLSSPDALGAFHEVLLRVAAANLPAEAADVLALSKLTALRKPGGGVRPIAAPSLLRRLTGRLLVTTRKKKLAEGLGKHQYAVGVPAGTELLAHTVRALTEDNPDLVLLALDAKNAYGTASRADCLTALGLLAPELLPCAELFCRRSSQYFFWDNAGECHKLSATSGVDQGDPLAPLLFASGLARPLRLLEVKLQDEAEARGLPRDSARVFAFLDDVALLLPPGLADFALPAAQDALSDYGLELAVAKTQAWSRRSPCPPCLAPYWRPAGLTLVGTPLGEPLPETGLPADGDELRVDLAPDDHAKQRCKEVVARAAALLERVAALPCEASPHQPGVQVAALLLRLCGCGKVTHLLRCNPPAVVQEAAQTYDKALRDCYEEITALDPLTTEQALQTSLPLRLGGRGLRSQAKLAPAAWVASWAQNLAQVLNRTGLESLADLDSCDLPLARTCRAALATLPRAVPTDQRDADLQTWRELALRPRPKVQKMFSRRIDENNYSSLLALLGTNDRARLRSCAAPLAAAWQWASPASPEERLDNATYRTTARSLLGQAVAPEAGATCQHRARTGARQRCGAPVCAQAHHAHRCGVGGGFHDRTAALERVWTHIERECGHTVHDQVHVPLWDRWRYRCTSPACRRGGHAWTLPTAPCTACGAGLEAWREEARLDLEVSSFQAPRVFYDVTVRHSVPGDAGRATAAANRGGVVAKEAEDAKRARYPDGRTPWRCVPLATESFGRHGQQALKHLRELAKEKAEAELEDEGAAKLAAGLLVQRWGAWLSAALHRANAALLFSALGPEREPGHRGLAAELAS